MEDMRWYGLALKLASRLRHGLRLAPLVWAVSACGASDSSHGTSSNGGTGATSAGDGFTINIELPPALEQRLTQLVHDLAQIVCQRSRTCCSAYGYPPLSDCTEVAGGPFILKLNRFGFDSSVEDYDFAIDEQLAAACLDAARSVQNDCTFATESLFFAWTDPCMNALKFAPKGEPLPECAGDADCAALHGPAHHCFNHACLPDVLVPTGASCRTEAGATAYSACAASDYCPALSSPTCTQRGLPGATCNLGDGTCVDGYSCVSNETSPGASTASCEPLRDAGEPCSANRDCKENACVCDPQVGCSIVTCSDVPKIGDPCSQTSDCRTPLFVCGPKGTCQPTQLTLCEKPM